MKKFFLQKKFFFIQLPKKMSVCCVKQTGDAGFEKFERSEK